MKKLSIGILVTAGLFFFFSCASKPLPPPQFVYGKGEIQLQLQAAPDLNTYEGSPHTLLLCLYQLKDPNAFNQLTGDEDGLYKLLECGPFDPSVTNIKRLIMRPGQATSVQLDRAEGTKYVGLVAGYSTMKKENMIRLFKIPVLVEKKGFISTTKVQKPGPLALDILLGGQQIKNVTSKATPGEK
ncbi:MAG: type VI secretion system lipoprotein TssJ [Deltaproteobacteria bacterium]|nr:MAG: type VI secretion system-associated lipoprotein [Desulfobacteraceae bacterium 4484_190.3]RLB17125.1 MAG: type VI secretion system lipoprotein TssJ [Deltaproteobacteria bacterium]